MILQKSNFCRFSVSSYHPNYTNRMLKMDFNRIYFARHPETLQQAQGKL